LGIRRRDGRVLGGGGHSLLRSPTSRVVIPVDECPSSCFYCYVQQLAKARRVSAGALCCLACHNDRQTSARQPLLWAKLSRTTERTGVTLLRAGAAPLRNSHGPKSCRNGRLGRCRNDLVVRCRNHHAVRCWNHHAVRCWNRRVVRCCNSRTVPCYNSRGVNSCQRAIACWSRARQQAGRRDLGSNLRRFLGHAGRGHRPRLGPYAPGESNISLTGATRVNKFRSV
jgi:hypothetical protein